MYIRGEYMSQRNNIQLEAIHLNQGWFMTTETVKKAKFLKPMTTFSKDIVMFNQYGVIFQRVFCALTFHSSPAVGTVALLAEERGTKHV